MPTKDFESTLPFSAAGGGWLPIVPVTLIDPSGRQFNLPLLFDTGASYTTLRHDLYPILGVPAWDSGTEVETDTAGGDQKVKMYGYQATLEYLGRTFVNCPVFLAKMPAHPLYLGLFGRVPIFESFGFGFWESARELYVTATP